MFNLDLINTENTINMPNLYKILFDSIHKNYFRSNSFFSINESHCSKDVQTNDYITIEFELFSDGLLKPRTFLFFKYPEFEHENTNLVKEYGISTLLHVINKYNLINNLQMYVKKNKSRAAQREEMYVLEDDNPFSCKKSLDSETYFVFFDVNESTINVVCWCKLRFFFLNL